MRRRTHGTLCVAGLLVWVLALTACPSAPTPTPVEPPPPIPGPVEPPPVTPPPATGHDIDEAAYAAVEIGITREALVVLAGDPFRITEAAGLVIYVYPFRGEDAVAWFFIEDGKVTRKNRR